MFQGGLGSIAGSGRVPAAVRQAQAAPGNLVGKPGVGVQRVVAQKFESGTVEVFGPGFRGDLGDGRAAFSGVGAVVRSGDAELGDGVNVRNDHC